MFKRMLLTASITFACAIASAASESDSVAISQNIQNRHTPIDRYGIILDPVFASGDPNSPEFDQIVTYTHWGDAAIWAGHYLAAEALRYRVSRDSDALRAVGRTLEGIRALIDVTGTEVMARCFAPVDSPYEVTMRAEEAGHGIYRGSVDGQDFYWVGRTSRDQYSGLFFGLGVAYDALDDRPETQENITTLVTRMLDYLLRHGWTVIMPDGSVSTSFVGRPDQQLSFLQVGRHMNAPRFELAYQGHRLRLASAVPVPVLGDSLDDHNHYFKFNLDYINLFNLIRLEESDSRFLRDYHRAYSILRETTRRHGNAHFNMIDSALQGPDEARDAETRDLLDSWLERPRRDYFVDLRLRGYEACGQPDRACAVIPVAERPNTDFLWQRSPRLLYGGGAGTIETAGIDYILPYWLARLNGVPVWGFDRPRRSGAVPGRGALPPAVLAYRLSRMPGHRRRKPSQQG